MITHRVIESRYVLPSGQKVVVHKFLREHRCEWGANKGLVDHSFLTDVKVTGDIPAVDALDIENWLKRGCTHPFPDIYTRALNNFPVPE